MRDQIAKGRSEAQALALYEVIRDARRAAVRRRRRKRLRRSRRLWRLREPDPRLEPMAARMKRIMQMPPRPVDRAAAEAAVVEHLRLLNVYGGRVRGFRWFASPSELPSGVQVSRRYIDRLEAYAPSRPWGQPDDGCLDVQLWRAMIGTVEREISVAVDAWGAPRRTVFRRRRRRGRGALRPVTINRIVGIGNVAEDFPLLGLPACVTAVRAPTRAARGYAALGAAAEAGLLGFWVTRDREVLCLPRPRLAWRPTPSVSWDGRARIRGMGFPRRAEVLLHNATGPAVLWPDGTAYFCWQGMAVPRALIMDPDAIDVATIDRTLNAELRRVLIERFGAERYLREGNAVLIDEGKRGRLWGKPMWDAEPLLMVEVVNATAEPDGTFKTYWLRVPPEMRSADEAVAWGFRESASGYNPDVET